MKAHEQFKEILAAGFITGSRRWDVSRFESDLDVVVRELNPHWTVKPPVNPVEVYKNKGCKFMTYKANLLGLTVNLIVPFTVAEYNAWVYASEEMDKYEQAAILKKCDRVRIFEELKSKYEADAKEPVI